MSLCCTIRNSKSRVLACCLEHSLWITSLSDVSLPLHVCWDNSGGLLDTVPPHLHRDRPPAGFPLPPPLCNYLIRYVAQWKLPTIPPNIPVSRWPAENSMFSVQRLWAPLTSAPLPPCFNESISASGTIPDPWQTSHSTYIFVCVPAYLRLSVLPHSYLFKVKIKVLGSNCQSLFFFSVNVKHSELPT